MKSSPIYNIIANYGRKGNASFGSNEGFTQDIRVGTSKTNSHTLGTISVERYVNDDGSVKFTLFIDGIPCKTGYLTGKQCAVDYRHEFEEHSQQAREDAHLAERWSA